MRKLATVLALAFALSIPACRSGPSQLVRSVDDWDNQLYVQSPWLDSILHVVPVIPLVKWGVSWVDVLVLNPIAFWTNDAWDSKGTGYMHKNPEYTDGYVRGVFVDDGGILRVER